MKKLYQTEDLPSPFLMRIRREAIEPVDPAAQFSLGTRYKKGEGVPKDGTKAIMWYHKAAEQGHVAAQFSLGMCYLTGDCVPRDHAESVKWISKAAEQGDAASQACLGSAYDTGLGVPKDYVMAYMWYNLVATNGNGHAAKMLDIIGHSMTAEQIAKAQKLSREWKPKKESKD